MLFFFKQKTAYEIRISDWSSDVCSSDLLGSSGQHGLATDGLRRLVVALVQAARDLSLGVVALGSQQLVDFRAGDRHQNCIDGGGGFLDGAIRKIGRATCRERVCQDV